ncbi:hypothetical protein [Helicobacter sp. 11S02596-1]|nr:hypothetical protein [Helicobacter sp. 11S02596-1]
MIASVMCMCEANTDRTKQQMLEADFIAYLDGFSPNIQEILDKFKFMKY